jgi:AcrR family transcriptional regulator
MPRPNLSAARRDELIGAVAATFAALGYRRTTTAMLAERCGVQEAILYRLWPDKRAMFVAAIEFVGSHSEQIWQRLLAARDPNSTSAERLLAHEATHLGEFGLYRILFAGFSETDDAVIAAAMKRVYVRFLRFITSQVETHRRTRSARAHPSPALTAWALVGLGTATNLGRELGLLGDKARKRLFAAIGGHLLG